MSEPVRVVVKVVAKPDATAAMREILLRLCRESRKESGCLSYDMLQNHAEPTVFVLHEEWESAARLDAHNKTPHFAEAVTQAQPMLAQALEVGRYRALL
jgi:quinol monooxygenase YgiN